MPTGRNPVLFQIGLRYPVGFWLQLRSGMGSLLDRATSSNLVRVSWHNVPMLMPPSYSVIPDRNGTLMAVCQRISPAAGISVHVITERTEPSKAIFELFRIFHRLQPHRGLVEVSRWEK